MISAVLGSSSTKGRKNVQYLFVLFQSGRNGFQRLDVLTALQGALSVFIYGNHQFHAVRTVHGLPRKAGGSVFHQFAFHAQDEARHIRKTGVHA